MEAPSIHLTLLLRDMLERADSQFFGLQSILVELRSQDGVASLPYSDIHTADQSEDSQLTQHFADRPQERQSRWGMTAAFIGEDLESHTAKSLHVAVDSLQKRGPPQNKAVWNQLPSPHSHLRLSRSRDTNSFKIPGKIRDYQEQLTDDTYLTLGVYREAVERCKIADRTAGYKVSAQLCFTEQRSTLQPIAATTDTEQQERHSQHKLNRLCSREGIG